VDYNFEVSEQPAQPVLSVRTTTAVADLPRKLGQGIRSYYQLFE